MTDVGGLFEEFKRFELAARTPQAEAAITQLLARYDAEQSSLSENDQASFGYALERTAQQALLDNVALNEVITLLRIEYQPASGSLLAKIMTFDSWDSKQRLQKATSLTTMANTWLAVAVTHTLGHKLQGIMICSLAESVLTGLGSKYSRDTLPLANAAFAVAKRAYKPGDAAYQRLMQNRTLAETAAKKFTKSKSPLNRLLALFR